MIDTSITEPGHHPTGEVQVVRLQPGDALAYISEERVSRKAAAAIEHRLRATWPHHDVVVLPQGELRALRREPEGPETTTMSSHAHLDHVTRDQLPPDAHAVGDSLDEWNHRVRGVTSSSHDVGLFLDLLSARGYRVTPDRWPVPHAWLAAAARVAERFDEQAAKCEEHIGTVAGADIVQAAWSRAAAWLRDALPELDNHTHEHAEPSGART